MAQVQAYNKKTKQLQMVPEHWLTNDHPAFKDFTTTIPKAAAPATATPAKPENQEA